MDSLTVNDHTVGIVVTRISLPKQSTSQKKLISKIQSLIPDNLNRTESQSNQSNQIEHNRPVEIRLLNSIESQSNL